VLKSTIVLSTNLKTNALKSRIVIIRIFAEHILPDASHFAVDVLFAILIVRILRPKVFTAPDWIKLRLSVIIAKIGALAIWTSHTIGPYVLTEITGPY
jgi:hypothetical protein